MTRKSRPVWPYRLTYALEKMWPTHTGGECVAEFKRLHGVTFTRNAIIGKAMREGFKKVPGSWKSGRKTNFASNKELKNARPDGRKNRF